MYLDEPGLWNHFASDSLNRSLLEQSAAINASLTIYDSVGWRQFYRHTVSSRYQVFDVISNCIVDKPIDFSDLKANTTGYLFRSTLMNRACEPRAGLSPVWLIGISGWPALTLFAVHTYSPLSPLRGKKRKKKKAQAGNERSNILPKSSLWRKKPPPPPLSLPTTDHTSFKLYYRHQQIIHHPSCIQLRIRH